LFDISQELAEQGIAKLSSLKPAPLYKPKNTELITPCNYDDHMEQIKEVIGFWKRWQSGWTLNILSTKT
jgi:hypothetical protein